jgi:hypothetical protein
MTPQEEQLLKGLIDRVRQTQLAEKDSEAEQMLTQTLGRNPDALYILCQTVLVQQYAMEQAQAKIVDVSQRGEELQEQIARLQQQLDRETALQQHPDTVVPPVQPERHTSFLGSLFGHSDPPAAPQGSSLTESSYTPVPYPPGGAPMIGGGSQQEQLQAGQPQPGGWNQQQPSYGGGAPAAAPQGYPPTGYPPTYGSPGYGAPQYGAPQYVPAPSSSGMFGGGVSGGGFLQTAMQTAAGVVAGEMAFRGIEDLMQGFGSHSGYGSDREIGGLGGNQPEVVNNYYGESGSDRKDGDRDRGGDSFGDRLQAADGDSNSLSPDIEDRRDETGRGRGFFGADAGQNFAGDSGADGSSADNSNGDSGDSDDSDSNSGDSDSDSGFNSNDDDGGGFDNGGGFDSNDDGF